VKTLGCETRTLVHFFVTSGEEHEDPRVTTRDPRQTFEFPEHCYAFVFYDQDVVEIDREDGSEQPQVQATTAPHNVSGQFVRKGRVLDKTGHYMDRIITGVVEMMTKPCDGETEATKMVELWCKDCGRKLGIVSMGKEDVVLEEASVDEPEENDRDPIGGLLDMLSGRRRRDSRPKPETAASAE